MFLKSRDGQFATVRSTGEELQLFANESSDGATSVTIERRYTGQTNQMAFKFQYKNEWYVPKVDGECLKLETAPNQLSNEHWFEKKDFGAGPHYGLQSVVEPRHYLSLDSPSFVLSRDDHKSVLVCVEGK